MMNQYKIIYKINYNNSKINKMMMMPKIIKIYLGIILKN